MFRLEWTSHERKPQAEIDELYKELLASIELDGPYEFSTLHCAAQLLETQYTLARVVGFPDHEPTLADADIIDFFTSTEDAIAALTAHRAGVLEFYIAFAGVSVLFEASRDEQIRLFLVPWIEASGISLDKPLPYGITEHPTTTCTRSGLIAHLHDLRREFSCAAIAHDPRLAAHEPLRRWSLGKGNGDLGH